MNEAAGAPSSSESGRPMGGGPAWLHRLTPFEEAASLLLSRSTSPCLRVLQHPPRRAESGEPRLAPFIGAQNERNELGMT